MIRTFTDANGIERTIQIDPLSLLKVQEATGLDLLALVDGSQAAELANNLPALANALGILAFPADMPERDVAEAMASDDVFPQAVDAFILALADYLPARSRRLLKKAWAASAVA